MNVCIILVHMEDGAKETKYVINYGMTNRIKVQIGNEQ